MGIELSKEEKDWIIKEIEITINSVRTDDVYDGVSFDKKSFDEGDYFEYKIEMLSKLYEKLKGG